MAEGRILSFLLYIHIISDSPYSTGIHSDLHIVYHMLLNIPYSALSVNMVIDHACLPAARLPACVGASLIQKEKGVVPFSD